MKPVNICNLCHTTLSYEHPEGGHFEFTGHTDEYCRNAAVHYKNQLELALDARVREKVEMEYIALRLRKKNHELDKELTDALTGIMELINELKPLVQSSTIGPWSQTIVATLQKLLKGKDS